MDLPLSIQGREISIHEREELERAKLAIEAQRATLGDAAVEAALEGLRRKLAAPENSPSSGNKAERKLVTVMFADLSGFTAMSESLDPERLRSLINDCFETLVPIVRNYGGTVDKFMGDEIMALFGAPEAHENDPERAIRAAFEMLDSLAEFNAARNTDLGMHFGINTGLVVAGGVGTAQRTEYTVMGDAVNLASRLEDRSERGEILVGPDTFRLAQAIFEFGPPLALELKGKEEPVLARIVMGIKSGAGQRRAGQAGGLSSPLVGRDAELAAILGCFGRLREGKGGFLCVTGEAGLGKTRLASEVRTLAQSSAEGWFLCLEGHALSFGQNISYWPFREIIRAFAAIGEEDDDEIAWGKLEASIAELFPDRESDYLPFLASLLSLQPRGEWESRLASFDAETLSKQIFLAAKRLFEALARRSPLVLVFEDIHWMDESTAALLEHILPLAWSLPLLVFCLTRPEPAGVASRIAASLPEDTEGRRLELRLDPLTPVACQTLVRNLLASGDLPERLVQAILGRAEGNPFYLEEVLRALIAMGAIACDPRNGRWRASEEKVELAIPDTIQGVIMARIDRLDEGTKEVLRAGAVIGRSFPYSVLSSLVRTEGELDSHLDELKRVELIFEKPGTTELEFCFKHALTQEAVYESILLERRKELHGRVALRIESLFMDSLEPYLGLLAYHYARAESWEKAQLYLFKAGDQAGRIAADGEALALYRQAVDAYSRVFGDRWDPLERAILERKMGEAFYRNSDYERSRLYLFHALELLGVDFPRGKGAIVLDLLKEVIVQAGHRFFLFPGHSLDRRMRRTGPDPRGEEVVTAGITLGWALIFFDQLQALLVSIKMLNYSERRGLPVGIVAGSVCIGYLFDCFGLSFFGGNYIYRARRVAETSGRKESIALAENIVSSYEHFTGRWRDSIESAERSVEAYREVGDLFGMVTPFDVSVCMYRLLGLQLQPLVGRLREMEETCRDAGDSNSLCFALDGLAHVFIYAGPLDEAVSCARESRELHLKAQNPGASADVGGELGFALLRMGRLDEAIAVLEVCITELEEHGIRGNNWTRPLSALIEARLVKAGEVPSPARGAWLRTTTRLCRSALSQGRIDSTCLIPALRLRARLEWLKGHGLAARAWWRRAFKDAERLEAVYEIATLKLEMGERLGDPGLIEEAASAYESMGAAVDLGFARAALERLGGAPSRSPAP